MTGKNGWWDTEEDIMEKKPLFDTGRKYIVNLEDVGEVECVWDGKDFYPNENINCDCIESVWISGICIGVNLNNRYNILSVRESDV